MFDTFAEHAEASPMGGPRAAQMVAGAGFEPATFGLRVVDSPFQSVFHRAASCLELRDFRSEGQARADPCRPVSRETVEGRAPATIVSPCGRRSTRSTRHPRLARR